MRVDLHMHTTASDGAWTPEAVVHGAAKGGLDVIAITDHDTTAAVAPALVAAADLNLQVIPGIEVSSTDEGRDIHVLGYFIDPTAASLVAHCERASSRREERMREMIELLSHMDVHVSFADVERAAGPDRVVLGRPHLARALVEGGHAVSMHDAFARLIGDDCPAFVSTHLLEPAGAIEMIIAGGGIPIWAHPPGDLVDALLPGMVDAGLRGLEVYRPRNKRHEILRFESICKTAGLLMGGGSDWHTPDYGSALGDFHVTGDEVEGLLAAGGL